ncbi:TetR/AcrR family transcriptional regulator [Gordonia sp. CPCC 206044]|uniref:TetR/AcrR family transcriptional regulator n=1 Tax=Gordonia sp. CPCC 206044 TaxID=3140793 RepID=UPI003AF3D06F
MSNDWLVGGNRGDSARERLVDLATELIAQRGVEGLDINELAVRAHCSRATIYRHTGGKSQIVEAVLARTSAAIATQIRVAITGTAGTERAAIALTTALDAIHGDRVAQQFVRSPRVIQQARTVVESPTVTALAADLIGVDAQDTVTMSFAVRSVLALVLWPPENRDDAKRHVALLSAAITA